jgi:sugar phosphate permease
MELQDVTKTGLSDVGQRARRRVAYRLLPFVFLLYLINYIDRINVSFANLKMSADLGFSDRVYGLGVGMFYLTYVLFEIPEPSSSNAGAQGNGLDES